ncbi:hypothetical protein NC652_010261 [Populus alba x Populus x berolinensis]|nr:hypothetical protein NC652_010261 [Populus alba x Populus x berolinensis]
MEMTRCLLHYKGLPKKLWAEAANTSIFLLNILLTKDLQTRTPFEAWFGYKPKLINLKIFGCLCFSYIPQNNRDQLDKKVEAKIFVGYNTVAKAYKIYIPQRHKKNEIDDEPVRGTINLANIYQRCNAVAIEPTNYEKVATDQEFLDAMKEELKMIGKNQTWKLVERPQHKKAIGVKWTFRTKLNSDANSNVRLEELNPPVEATRHSHKGDPTSFLDPIIFGNYPAEISKILGSTLPKFSSNDKEKLKNGLDFIGINHYTSEYVQDCIFSVCEPGTGASRTEGLARRSQEKDGAPIGIPTDVDRLHFYPQGMEKMVTYIKKRYNNKPMIITENGYGQQNNPNLTIVCHDIERVEFISNYWDSLLTPMEKGADVRGYFAWSLLDNFEWTRGYTQRYGLYHVDFTTLKRTPKLSATWFKEFIARYKVEGAFMSDGKGLSNWDVYTHKSGHKHSLHCDI